MPFPARRGARRAIACLGAAAALTLGACGTSGAVAPPPPPLPPAQVPAAQTGAPASPPVPIAAEPWDRLVRCETGGDWHADTGNGYHGGLQLSPRTWAVHGGGAFAPQADEASREEQIVVGERVRAEQGWEAWSSCADEVAPS